MDPAFLLLMVFMVYSVLLGVCLARMKAINRELDTMKTVIATIGNIQRDDDSSVEIARSKPLEITPEMLARIRDAMAMDGFNG